jgi:uncharacterized lipoprotein YddW (UPF0748 family)
MPCHNPVFLPPMRQTTLKTVFFYLLMAVAWSAAAQQPPKREFRAAWIATVANIDYPSKSNLTPEQQRSEFINIVEQHRLAGLNAVVVQIRPSADAFYASPFEPWSEYLTGKQGQAPQPFYDPLTFMIGECRKRGLEFHAWMNPYRAISDATVVKIDSSRHVAALHPEWILAYGNLRLLNPGLPEARKYVVKIVMDVVRRYDVDGIHFDDYFYPYPLSGAPPFNDDAAYQQDPRNIANRADWRRDNVNLLIRQLNDSIRAVKPWVKFGISPFGIWQNKSAGQPLGSETSGLQSHSAVYADSRAWIEQNWIDYLAPQVYWYIGFAAADYAKLVPWWNNNAFDRHLYIGQAMYRVNTNVISWQNPAEMPKQIRLNRKFDKVRGSIFYNTRSLNANPLGVRDSLRKNLYNKPALMPRMPWKDSVAPPPPAALKAGVETPGKVLLTWQKPATGTGELEKVRAFAVYRFPNGEMIDLGSAAALRAVLTAENQSFTDTFTVGKGYKYVVTALDRLHNESLPSNLVVVGTPVAVAEPPEEAKRLRLVIAPNPSRGRTTITYHLPVDTHASLYVAEASGRMVAVLMPMQKQNAGVHTIDFQSNIIPAGTYVCALRTTEGGVFNQLVSVR